MVLLLAATAIAVGDATEVLVLLATQGFAWSALPGGWANLFEVAGGAIAIFIMGLVLVGWWALAFTAIAATVWAGAMALLRGFLIPTIEPRP